MKQIIRTIAKKVRGVEQGMEKWFKHFDVDGSDEIEINELIKMLKYLKENIEDRLVVMLFRLFDRGNQGYFSYKDFVDILTKRMKPNYRRIVFSERQRFKLEGLDIKFPDRKRKRRNVEVQEKIVENVIERVVEKEKEVVVENIIERPRYVEVGPMQRRDAQPAGLPGGKEPRAAPK